MVTMADREAAVHEFTKLRFGQVSWSAQGTMAWSLYRDTGEQTHFPERMWWDVTELARTIARVRIAAEQRTREECAREVEAMAGDMAALDEASSEEADGPLQPDPSFPYDQRSFLMGRAMGYEVAERELRALAERMRKGGG